MIKNLKHVLNAKSKHVRIFRKGIVVFVIKSLASKSLSELRTRDGPAPIVTVLYASIRVIVLVAVS